MSLQLSHILLLLRYLANAEMSLLAQVRINSLLMVEAVFTEFSVYPQCCFTGRKAGDAIFRIARALREVVAHVVSPEGMPAL